MHRLLSVCLFISLGLSAQGQSAPLTTLSYPIAAIQDGEWQAQAVSTELTAFYQQRILSILPDQIQGDLNWVEGKLVKSSYSSWLYESYWQTEQGHALARFRLRRQGDQLVLLEVGSYQVCFCTDCTTLTFAADGRSCEGDGQEPIPLRLGEVLH